MHRVPVDVLLRAVRVVHVVEREGLVRAQERLRLSRRLCDANLAGVDDLAGQLRPDAGGHADARAAVVGHGQAVVDRSEEGQGLLSFHPLDTRRFFFFYGRGE